MLEWTRTIFNLTCPQFSPISFLLLLPQGAQDPNWVGKFTLTKFMAEFDPTIVKKRKERAVTYKHDDMIGAWRIETFKYVKPRKDSKKGKKRRPNVYKGEPEVVEAKSELQTSQVFDVEFFSNSTWQSINGFGEDGRLAGKWNVFSDNIDLGTGIKGKGTRVWFEARRFSVMGGALSYGAGLTHGKQTECSIFCFLFGNRDYCTLTSTTRRACLDRSPLHGIH